MPFIVRESSFRKYKNQSAKCSKELNKVMKDLSECERRHSHAVDAVMNLRAKNLNRKRLDKISPVHSNGRHLMAENVWHSAPNKMYNVGVLHNKYKTNADISYKKALDEKNAPMTADEMKRVRSDLMKSHAALPGMFYKAGLNSSSKRLVNSAKFTNTAQKNANVARKLSQFDSMLHRIKNSSDGPSPHSRQKAMIASMIGGKKHKASSKKKTSAKKKHSSKKKSASKRRSSR